MTTISITKARCQLHKLVNDVNVGVNPITIINYKGENAVFLKTNGKILKKHYFFQVFLTMLIIFFLQMKTKIGKTPKYIILMMNGDYIS